MTKRIKAGSHRAWPPSFGFWWGKRKFTREIVFHSSCRYQPDAENDINKLWGVGYFPSHHKDSCRFGWRFNPANDKIEILSYCYVNGHRRYQHICYVDFEKPYEYSIFITSTTYQFVVGNEVAFEDYRHNKRLQFALGFWFGGNKPASHKMSIEIR